MRHMTATNDGSLKCDNAYLPNSPRLPFRHMIDYNKGSVDIEDCHVRWLKKMHAVRLMVLWGTAIVMAEILIYALHVLRIIWPLKVKRHFCFNQTQKSIWRRWVFECRVLVGWFSVLCQRWKKWFPILKMSGKGIFLESIWWTNFGWIRERVSPLQISIWNSWKLIFKKWDQTW